jgi:hypothetical protein
VVPLAGSGAALTDGGVFPGPAIPAKCVLAKSIIEKLPMMAPMSPTTAVPKMLFRDFTCSDAPVGVNEPSYQRAG